MRRLGRAEGAAAALDLLIGVDVAEARPDEAGGVGGELELGEKLRVCGRGGLGAGGWWQEGGWAFAGLMSFEWKRGMREQEVDTTL